ncbi:MAG: ester cyclase [Gemmatimonadales bacterium]
MPAHATMLSPQQLIDAAKAPLLTYGEKDWDAVRASITPDFVYDEVGTGRKVQGLDQVLALWRGWATALPDSKATFHSALVSGNTVVLEVTWRGTHTGPLEMPNGPIAATGKRIELRACNVIEIAADRGKAKLQRQYFDMGTMLQQLGIMS